MTLMAGNRLGPYEIVAPLGAGGMGEVYRARDPRLGREVAIKVLPASFSQDADRLKRFEQEARAAGVLNHPNITAVHDLGSHDGAPYIVTELLEGETLRSRLSSGSLPVRKAIDYAIQIAKGLAAAHEKGIVHRDLKPENLFVTNDGRVKILDFGLAKLKAEKSAGDADRPADGLGRDGARNRPRDDGLHVARAGAREARGQALGPLLLRDDPLRDALGPARLPRRHRGRHDHGDPDEGAAGSRADEQGRPAGARADRAALPGEEPGGAVRVGAGRRLRPRVALDGVFADGPARGGRGADHEQALGRCPRSSPRRSPSPPASRAGYRVGKKAGYVPPPAFQELTFRRGELYSARFAPDGQTVIYSAAWEGKPVEVFATRTDRPESRVFGLTGADVMAISKTGEMLVTLGRHVEEPFIRSGTLAEVGVSGGVAPRELLTDVQWADWSPDGKDFLVVRDQNQRNRLEYPVGNVLYQTRRVGQPPAHLAGRQPRRFPGSPAPPRRRRLGRRRGPRRKEADPGGTVFLRVRSGLVARRPARSGSPRRRSAATAPCTRSGSPADTRLIARVPQSLTLQDVAARRPGARGPRHHPHRHRRAPRRRRRRSGSSPGSTGRRVFDLTRDGKTILFSETGEGSGPGYSVFVRGTDGSPPVRLGEGVGLALSPDAAWAVAITARAEKPQYVLYPTGPGEKHVLATGDLALESTAAFLPDGKRLVITASEPGHRTRLYLARPSRRQAAGIHSRRVSGVFPRSVSGRKVRPGGRAGRAAVPLSHRGRRADADPGSRARRHAGAMDRGRKIALRLPPARHSCPRRHSGSGDGPQGRPGRSSRPRTAPASSTLRRSSRLPTAPPMSSDTRARSRTST